MAKPTETGKDAVAEFTARHRFARITARKARLIADEIRGKGVNAALDLLEFAPQRAVTFYLKVLRSAVANATALGEANVNRLVITDARADDGPLLQGRMRWRPGPQGRAMPFRRVTSHLIVKVREDENVPEKRQRKQAARPAAGAGKGGTKKGVTPGKEG